MTTKPQNINLSESGRVPFLRHVEAHLAETSRDTTTEFVSQGPHGGKAPSGRRASGESGRSMVEMLGTLAIMGVLSIGGVAGYRYAMDKLNANTILSEISKRAMTASQQRLVGQPINLNEYGVAKIQDFDVSHTNDVDGDTAFFSLSVANVPKGICDKVIQDRLRTATEVWLNTNTDVTDGETCDDSENGNTIEFVFANTLDTNATPTEPTPAGPSCPSGSSTDSTTNTGGSFSVTVDTETIWCYCPTGKKYNTETKACDADITATCSSWMDCGAGKYCQISASTRTSLGAGDNGTCYSGYSGTCTHRTAFTASDAIVLQASDETTPYATVYKGPTMTWWSAVDYCASQKHPVTGQPMKLFDINGNRLECGVQNNGVDLGTSGTYAWGYCNQTAAYNSSGQTKSLRMQVFQIELDNSGSYWTTSLYNSSGSTTCTTQSCNSCNAVSVTADTGYVRGNYLYSFGNSALCE